MSCDVFVEAHVSKTNPHAILWKVGMTSTASIDILDNKLMYMFFTEDFVQLTEKQPLPTKVVVFETTLTNTDIFSTSSHNMPVDNLFDEQSARKHGLFDFVSPMFDYKVGYFSTSIDKLSAGSIYEADFSQPVWLNVVQLQKLDNGRRIIKNQFQERINVHDLLNVANQKRKDNDRVVLKTCVPRAVADATEDDEVICEAEVIGEIDRSDHIDWKVNLSRTALKNCSNDTESNSTAPIVINLFFTCDNQAVEETSYTLSRHRRVPQHTPYVSVPVDCYRQHPRILVKNQSLTSSYNGWQIGEPYLVDLHNNAKQLKFRTSKQLTYPSDKPLYNQDFVNGPVCVTIVKQFTNRSEVYMSPPMTRVDSNAKRVLILWTIAFAVAAVVTIALAVVSIAKRKAAKSKPDAQSTSTVSSNVQPSRASSSTS